MTWKTYDEIMNTMNSFIISLLEELNITVDKFESKEACHAAYTAQCANTAKLRSRLEKLLRKEVTENEETLND